ncbi:MAG: response regulator [Gemmatimonadetes bacterium]|jgi:CheY-like chemotaxis protein|nr:response regulator [Gemmatimonadota bacterium]
MPMERNKALVQTIQKIPVFNGLSPSQGKKVLGLCVPKILQGGDTLCARGTPSDAMYILVSGQLGIITEDGLRVATLKPVTTVGEMGMVTRQTRSASVVAVDKSNILIIEKGPFDLLLRTDPDIQLKVLRNIIEILSGKIVNDNVRIRDHLLEKVRGENQIIENKQKIKIALDLLEENSNMTREEAKTQIDEKMISMSMRILVVDDEPPIRKFLKDVLSSYEVVEAGDGLEALKQVEVAKPHLVITDIRMPKMDGYELRARLNETHPEMPVLALSGYVGAEDVEGHGFDGFVDKPVNLEEFRKVVEEALVKEDD